MKVLPPDLAHGFQQPRRRGTTRMISLTTVGDQPIELDREDGSCAIV